MSGDDVLMLSEKVTLEMTKAELLLLHSVVAKWSGDEGGKPSLSTAERCALHDLECKFETLNDTWFLPESDARKLETLAEKLVLGAVK